MALPAEHNTASGLKTGSRTVRIAWVSVFAKTASVVVALRSRAINIWNLLVRQTAHGFCLDHGSKTGNSDYPHQAAPPPRSPRILCAARRCMSGLTSVSTASRKKWISTNTTNKSHSR